MGDLERPTRGMVPIDGDLAKKQRVIQVNEKRSVIDALNIKLRDLKEIEQKKIEFQIELLEREIDFLKNKDVVDTEIDLEDE